MSPAIVYKLKCNSLEYKVSEKMEQLIKTIICVAYEKGNDKQKELVNRALLQKRYAELGSMNRPFSSLAICLNC
jgi:hypothetical protein